MKTNLKRPFLCFILCVFNISTVGCDNDEDQNFLIRFHIGDEIKEVCQTDGTYNAGDVSQEHKRFLGWSKTTGKEFIISEDVNLNASTVEEILNGNKNVDLYAVYADVLTVNFMLEHKVTLYLDSELNNVEAIPNAFKGGYTFKGWSKDETSNQISLIASETTISYSTISLITSGEYEVNLYPIYVENNIKLYAYNTAEQMAEIHIETENHIAIDDSSLIKSDEHKGKNGELPAYDYVKASISVDHCEDKYALNEVSGKVKVRGNYTSSYAKKPIRIKFDKKQKMLGLNKDNSLKSWVLLANWKDSSMFRDASAFYLANAILESMKQKFPQPAFPDEVKELEKLIESKMPKKAVPAKKAEPAKKTPAKQQTKTPAKTKK